ncbi:hypothetical protein CHCC20335_1522 [Bacillus paralicheniformis]|nr:hypothetical protein CHCC20335_1522 [Bacillus paralicheniformis]
MKKKSTHFFPFEESPRRWERIMANVEWALEQLTERFASRLSRRRLR